MEQKKKNCILKKQIWIYNRNKIFVNKKKFAKYIISYKCNC